MNKKKLCTETFICRFNYIDSPFLNERLAFKPLNGNGSTKTASNFFDSMKFAFLSVAEFQLKLEIKTGVHIRIYKYIRMLTDMCYINDGSTLFSLSQSHKM